jgi:EpsI family protein
MTRAESVATGVAALPLPVSVGSWSRSVPSLDYRPAFVGPHAEAEAGYIAAGSSTAVYAYVADYAFPSPGRKAVSNVNTVFDRGWVLAERARRQIAPGLAPTETLIRAADGREKLVWHWYVIGGRNVAGEVTAKLHAAWTQVRGDPAVAVVVLAVDVQPGRADAARATLARFASDAEPALAAALLESRRPR